MKETDKLGKDAYLGIPDVGPADVLKLENALKIKDNHPSHMVQYGSFVNSVI